MDAKSLKYIFVLFFLILDSGRVRESFAEACLFKEECSDDEYCDESSRLCIKLVARDSIRSETPLYQRNQPQEEWTDQGYDSYQKDYEQNDPEESQERQTGRGTRWESSENEDDYNDRNLRQPMQGRDSRQDQRVTDDGHGPLPPVVGTGWDKIGAGHGKDRVNLRYDVRRHQRKYDQREFEDYDENFPAKRHLRQREESAIDAMTDDETDNIRRTNGNGDFSNLDNGEAVDRGARDSIKFNQDSSSEGSQRLTDSETSSEKLPLDESRSAKSFPNNERRIPPVPLQGDERPIPSDNSASRGNQMQTEKQAGEIASMKNAGPAGKGKVMVKGKVQQIKDDIDQGPNPEKTYKRVEDFFETQRESSIVEVPNAVKKEEETKLFKDNFVPVDKHSRDEVDKEEAASPTHDEGDIKLSLNRIITAPEANIVAAALQNALWINAPSPMFTVTKVDDSKVKLKMARTDYTLEEPNYVAERIRKEPSVRGDVARNSGIHIVGADYEDISSKDVKGHPKRSVEAQQPKYFLITIIVVGCVTGVVLTAVAIYLIMKRYNETKNFKPVTLPGQEAAADYQELCRQLRATQGWDSGPVKTTHLQQGDNDKGLGSGRAPKYSWSEEPVVPNMDISTGHVVLAYMEDHLNNKDRLNKEWEALKTYEAEPNSREIGKLEKNARKNRYSDVLPYDHNRVLLKETASATGSDYINGSYITDHDPKNPAYIATQGPLAHTVSDFWQMVWEQGVVVIVNLTKLSDLGLPQCHRYWPEEGQPIITYRIYEVHLVSEHIWCEDYLVRSFYLKNLQTSETRTVTQFHFLSWPDLNVPSTPKPLLEFRRKVNKCFRGRASPVIVHCSGGVGRTGTYILIDMVLNKMMRGAKEIDIAATVEHLRDQRPSMVKTKAQFEFALTAVAEEVNAILQALSK